MSVHLFYLDRKHEVSGLKKRLFTYTMSVTIPRTQSLRDNMVRVHISCIYSGSMPQEERSKIMNFGAYIGTACIATPPHLQREIILLSFYFVECKQMLSRETILGS